MISNSKPHVKSLGPNSKFLTNRIALFRFQLATQLVNSSASREQNRPKVLAERDAEGFRV